MAWTLTDDLNDYVALAGGFLRSRPVQHTIQLVAAETLRARGAAAFGETAPLFGWWRSNDGEITAALLHTPPYPVLLTRLPERSAEPLAEALITYRRPLAGVNAEQGDAAAFAAAWCRLTGVSSRESRRSRLFRLERLRRPDPGPPGAAREATAADRALLESWLAAFGEETGESFRSPSAVVDDHLSHDGLTLWEDGGAVVSLAGQQRPAAGAVRLGPVYTPPGYRGRGYAGAVTAAVSQAALDAGADHVILFTDLANPVSNALYQRLGYRPVEDRAVLRFGP
jgi:RimJ/RimL family protein N-acetyltransferase